MKRQRLHAPIDVVAANLLWAGAAIALLLCGILFVGTEHAELGIFLGFTSGVLAPAAGVVTLWGWLADVDERVRNAASLARAANRPRGLGD